jgi:tyrosyl-DNA phosphodiesterase 1
MGLIVSFKCIDVSLYVLFISNSKTLFSNTDTKMFLVGFQQFLRVVIHTSNLIHNDIYLKAQGSYVQDFPLKTNDSQLQCEFEQTLVSYLSSYGYNKKNKWSAYGDNITLNDQIARYDFDLALVKLIPSVPGYYNFPEKCNAQGYLRLKSMISEYILSHERKDNKLGPIVCQFSSIGSLSEKWIRDFASSLSADTEKGAVDADKLMLVYPTVEEIRTSMEGYAGGASVPGKSKNLQKTFIGPLLHKWSGGISSIHKPSNVPHIKTYYQLSKEKDSLEWFVLTSHNLSKAAWGEVINSQYGKCLRTLSWEMGVFCCPKLVGDQQLVPFDMRNDPGSFVIPLPYQSQPERYGVDDQPWAVDEKYEKSDAFGNFG